MSVSTIPIENLLNDAMMLSMSLKECETETDNLIHQTVTLNKDNENIKEYSEEMNALSNTSVKQPRRQLIASIQCESKKLKQLEAENLELKSTLQDYELVMKLMSQKYRSHVSKLISHMNAESKLNVSNVINAKYKQKIDEQALKIEQLTAFIQKLMNLDIQNFLDIQKSLTKLELDNEGLRQMLGIAREHNNCRPNPSTVEAAVQAGADDDLELQNGVASPESRSSNDVASPNKSKNWENSLENNSLNSSPSGSSNKSSPGRLSGKENDNETNSLNNDAPTGKALDQVNSTSTIKKFVKEFVSEQKDKKQKEMKVTRIQREPVVELSDIKVTRIQRDPFP